MALALIILLAFTPRVTAFEANPEYDFLYMDLSTIDNRGCDLQATGLAENLKSAASDHRLDVTIGGQPLLVGLTNERVAGLELATALGQASSVTTFGGLPTTQVTDNGILNNLVYGGRIDTRLIPACRIGLSVLRNNAQDHPQEAATDIDFTLGSSLTFSGLSTHKRNQWREHRYSARLRYDAFELTPVFEHFFIRDDTDRFNAESHLFGFLTGADENVNMAGTDLGWQGHDSLNVGLRTRRYDYASRDEDALYFSGMISLKAPAGLRIDLEIGDMQGQIPETVYRLVSAGAVVDRPFGLQGGFLSASARYIDYDQPVNDRDIALHTIWSAGSSFLDDRLETKISGIYRMDPYFGDDIRAMLSIQFRI